MHQPRNERGECRNEFIIFLPIDPKVTKIEHLKVNLSSQDFALKNLFFRTKNWVSSDGIDPIVNATFSWMIQAALENLFAGYSKERYKEKFYSPYYCQAPTQLPTWYPLQFNSISTSSQFNSSKSWVGVMPYIWFSPPPTILLFSTRKPSKWTPSTQIKR